LTVLIIEHAEFQLNEQGFRLLNNNKTSVCKDEAVDKAKFKKLMRIGSVNKLHYVFAPVAILATAANAWAVLTKREEFEKEDPNDKQEGTRFLVDPEQLKKRQNRQLEASSTEDRAK
jgi:hypothetical protein